MSVRAWAPVAVVFEPQARRCSDWRCSASSSAPPRLCPICGLKPVCRPPASLSDLWTQACLPPSLAFCLRLHWRLQHASQRANRVIYDLLKKGFINNPSRPEVPESIRPISAQIPVYNQENIWCRRRRGHSLPTRFPSTSNYTYLYAHMGWHFRCLDRGKRVEYADPKDTTNTPWSGQATRKAPSGLEVPLKRGKANGHYNDQKSRV
ncbi:uncharacterized protein PITG_00131 [Phytophthora infestans T30-4]|uniref:Uncharacterized protein n=1 Tax=Phytophthora infestans (strain T30-4) TaxID=403677 RepID=D0MSY8_PHYIT|nr:uncharacterized protein PITG_00131 [Phytophthora infestans T30-4]EEY57572.1 hypothetical protein PITG_00131 [Phytophthora infestans T30-4]|eukprot:XP_002908758.1 hypothetical protein PITG_00131 [Phytophthora infestans T30-4]